ncbi:efflux RND transporter periplasmic adaptor subunit [Pseudomonas mangrovi]|uniref:Efflux transporter periplasmic adaptor subunit n=1 Tax=Pseudomonas mangrovi TaxID=2161748 RepID=A0A2T5PEP9_9PSED|nr:efflux RND transporter periplasmic adaptor subunit [Pseudomonas mangrovi]PTU76215.1 efflux transporter periplasmic adaptor subunit [Pseudomonas mangrovi]
MLLRRMLIMIGVVVLVVVALGAYKGYSIYSMIQGFSQPKPPISIAAAHAEAVQWQSRLPAIGTLKAFQGVELTAEVGGTVKAVQFDSGEKVTAGQPIIEMDSAVEQASLATAEASLGLARVEFERGRNLVARQAISKSEFDRLSAELEKANASVAQLRATLAKKRIVAPFAGTVGIRQVDVGTYVSPGSPIATLQDLSTLFVDFFLPEQDAPLLALGQSVELSVAAYPDEQFVAEIVAINPKVETTTRNLLVRARLANPEGKLLPGMFANLEVLLPNPQERVVVPETAITFTLYGNSVYVISEQPADKQDPQTESDAASADEPRLVVERRFVETGERRGARVVVLRGLEAGEQVVTAGQLKIDNGSHVRIEDDPIEQARRNREQQAN